MISKPLLYSLAGLSPLAYRLFLFLYSLPRLEHTNVQTTLPIIRNTLGLSAKNENNKNILAAVDELLESRVLKSFKTNQNHYGDGKICLIAAVLPIKNYRWSFDFTLNPKILEMEQSGNWSPIPTSIFPKLKSIYALKLFMLLFANRQLKQRKINLTHPQFCVAVGLNPKLRPSEVRRRLQPALLEIQEYGTNLFVGSDNFSFSKKSNIWSICWQFSKKEPQKEALPDSKNLKNMPKKQFITLLRSLASQGLATLKVSVTGGTVSVNAKGYIVNLSNGQTLNKNTANQIWTELYKQRQNLHKYIISPQVR